MKTPPISASAPSQALSQTLSQSEIIDLLRQHLEAGCNEALADSPQNQFEVSQAASAKAGAKTKAAVGAGTAGAGAGAAKPIQAKPKKQKQEIVRPKPASSTPEAPAPDANLIAQSATTLDALQQALRDYDGCALKQSAKHTVFCDGTRGAKIMVVGESPGADEDRDGRPFIGVSGQLLDKMLAAINLSREENVYLTNVVAWRPIGNRNPTAEEIEQCRPFVVRHIELAKPDILLLVGGVTTKTLLNTSTGITRLRGQWTTYDEGGMNIRTLPLLHPAYLMRKPQAKKDMWADLCLLRQEL
ncbi:MAG: uracil-DNA glycosylase [Alphaproteobacteria bacterium]|nr:uracil-DNA glycosylase [Alphaproteobacteria bacterium]